jgi:hypothetical protein
MASLRSGQGSRLREGAATLDDGGVAPRAGAGRVRPVVDDPQELSRVGPHDLKPCRPPWVPPGRVALQVPWCDRAVLAKRATPLPPESLRVVVGEQLRRPASTAAGLAVGAHQQRKDALDLKEGPVGGAAEGAARPLTAVVFPPQCREDPAHQRGPLYHVRSAAPSPRAATVTAPEPTCRPGRPQAGPQDEAILRCAYPASGFLNVTPRSRRDQRRQRASEGALRQQLAALEGDPVGRQVAPPGPAVP